MSEAEILAGRYRVVRTIGAGGAGVVYLVEDTQNDNRPVALKALKRKAGPEGGVAERDDDDRFRAEYRKVHGVVHPNIPEVYDFGQLDDGSLYFTTEYIDGTPLSDVRHRWSPAQLHEILVELCRALAFLHSRGVLHRDIKPENVLARLGESGGCEAIKLVDFGLAARKKSRFRSSHSTPDSLLSGSGADGAGPGVSGTIDYLAPELIGGSEGSVASDLYALGMLMYRLAAGRLPFDAQDPLALARQRTLAEVPPLLRYRPDIPVGLSDVIGVLLRLRPDERPASARHVIALLNEREGTEFPYETSASRSAYIRSAASVANRPARERIAALLQGLTAGERPRNVMMLGMKGLGMTRLFGDLAIELTLASIPARLVKSYRDLDWGSEPPRVVLVPDSAVVPDGRLRARIGAFGEAWWIVGAEQEDLSLYAALARPEVLQLAPLELPGVQEFVAATFPENTFPAGFANQVLTETLGLPGAVQALFDDLLQQGLLRIGLYGWELLPGAWNVSVHEHAARFVERQMALLPEPGRWLAQALACTDNALPMHVLRQFAAADGRTGEQFDEALSALLRNGWLKQDAAGCTLARAAVQRQLYAQLTVEARRLRHRTLTTAWAQDRTTGHAQRAREVLYHDVHAASWTVSAADAEATLRTVTEAGGNDWVRRIVETGLEHAPAGELRRVLLRALAEIEFIESNLAQAAECFAQVLDHGQADVTPRNARDFVRYAAVEEKLGHTEFAEDILRRCAAVLEPGLDTGAGAVFGILAWIAFRRGDAEQARQLAEEGLVRVPPKAMDAGLALLLNTVATLAFYSGDVDAAAMAWKRCLEVNEEIRDLKGIATMYNNLGVLAAQSGDRLRARTLWEKCGEIAREIHDMHRLAGIYNNLGIDSLESGMLPQAEEYYLKALTMFRRLKSPRDQVEILNNLGELSYYRADYPRAQAYWQEALNLAASVDDRESQVEPLVYLGKLLAMLEDLEQAETALTTALTLAHELAVKKGEGQAWEGLALLHARRGEGAKSADALRNAHAVLTEEVDPLACLHLHLTECAIAAGQGDDAKSQEALAAARKVADTKWDPYTAARTLVCGLLFAREQLDQKERPRLLRQLSNYPDFLWKFHWASGRRLAAEGALRHALEEYGRGVTVLKAIAARMSEGHRARYLRAPHIDRFRAEALELRRSLQQ